MMYSCYYNCNNCGYCYDAEFDDYHEIVPCPMCNSPNACYAHTRYEDVGELSDEMEEEEHSEPNDEGC